MFWGCKRIDSSIFGMAYSSLDTEGSDPYVKIARPRGKESVLSAVRITCACCSFARSCSLYKDKLDKRAEIFEVLLEIWPFYHLNMRNRRR